MGMHSYHKEIREPEAKASCKTTIVSSPWATMVLEGQFLLLQYITEEYHKLLETMYILQVKQNGKQNQVSPSDHFMMTIEVSTKK